MIVRTEAIPMEQLAQLLDVQLEQGEAPLRVTGTSMYPTFRNGVDTVFLRKPEGTLRKGDVLLYRRENGQYVLHRIVRLQGQTLILSGDNQHEPEYLKPSQVIARVERFRRGKREYTSTHLGYRAWVWLWVWLFPVRRPLLQVRNRIWKALRTPKKK